MGSVIITGAAGSLGWACVQRFLSQGTSVLGVDLVDAAQEVAGTSGELQWYVGDLTVEDQDGSLSAAVGSMPAPLEALVHLVGGASIQPFEQMGLKHWESQIRLNLTSAFIALKVAVPHMVQAGGGSVVLASSGWAYRPAPGRVAYAASKLALAALVRTLAVELADTGIRINAVAPGAIDTPRVREMAARDDLMRGVHEQIPLGRLGTPEEVAGTVAFLCGKEATYLTGQVIHVNGGLVS